MATKNIAITEDAYNLLARYKRPGESFSDVIKEQFTKRKTLADFAGMWEDLPKEEFEAFRRTVEGAHRGLNKSFRKRIGKLWQHDRR